MDSADPDVPATGAVTTRIFVAAPGLPVAVNVTGDPVSDPDVAVRVFDPAVVPRVQAGDVAMPDESVVTVPDAASEPPPLPTAKMTDSPCTGLPAESVTNTDGAVATALPAVADWPSPAFAAIVVALPAPTVIDCVATVKAPDEYVIV